MKPVVFLDRDGTLIEEVNFLADPAKIRIFDYTPRALKILREAGFLRIVLSNQSGVGRGILTEEIVEEVNKAVFSQLRMLGEVPEAFYYCPHHPYASEEKYKINCECRKPGTGMVREASTKFEFDLNNCYSIGDKLADVGVAQNLGGKGILILTGHGEKEKDKISDDCEHVPDFIAENLLKAVECVIKDYTSKK